MNKITIINCLWNSFKFCQRESNENDSYPTNALIVIFFRGTSWGSPSTSAFVRHFEKLCKNVLRTRRKSRNSSFFTFSWVCTIKVHAHVTATPSFCLMSLWAEKTIIRMIIPSKQTLHEAKNDFRGRWRPPWTLFRRVSAPWCGRLTRVRPKMAKVSSRATREFFACRNSRPTITQPLIGTAPLLAWQKCRSFRLSELCTPFETSRVLIEFRIKTEFIWN